MRELFGEKKVFAAEGKAPVEKDQQQREGGKKRQREGEFGNSQRARAMKTLEGRWASSLLREGGKNSSVGPASKEGPKQFSGRKFSLKKRFSSSGEKEKVRSYPVGLPLFQEEDSRRVKTKGETKPCSCRQAILAHAPATVEKKGTGMGKEIRTLKTRARSKKSRSGRRNTDSGREKKGPLHK